MSEYKVRFRVTIPGFFGLPESKEGVEIYEAENTKQATAKANYDLRLMLLGEDDYETEILDVEKL